MYTQYKKIERRLEKELKTLSISAQVYSIKFMKRRFINVDFKVKEDLHLFKLQGTTSFDVYDDIKGFIKADIRYRVR